MPLLILMVLFVRDLQYIIFLGTITLQSVTVEHKKSGGKIHARTFCDPVLLHQKFKGILLRLSTIFANPKDSYAIILLVDFTASVSTVT